MNNQLLDEGAPQALRFMGVWNCLMCLDMLDVGVALRSGTLDGFLCKEQTARKGQESRELRGVFVVPSKWM